MIRSFKITSKLYDLYKSKKEIDNCKCSLFKSGMFYIFVSDDAKYVSKKTLLKLSNLSNDVVKCGFPYNKLDKYMELFNNLGIEVEIVKNNIDNSDKIIKKLKHINIDNITPYESLKMLHELVVMLINDLEGLMIYKQYIELIDYTLMILKKYPKSKRIIILNNIDNYLKFLKVLIRISYKQRYISSKNYSSWSKKITNINNLLYGWIKACLKV